MVKQLAPKIPPDKCNVLSAGKSNTPQLEYTLCNTKLKYTDKEKDIGVIVDNKLNFEENMNEKINKTTNTSIQEKKRRYDRNIQDNIWSL